MTTTPITRLSHHHGPARKFIADTRQPHLDHDLIPGVLSQAKDHYIGLSRTDVAALHSLDLLGADIDLDEHTRGQCVLLDLRHPHSDNPKLALRHMTTLVQTPQTYPWLWRHLPEIALTISAAQVLAFVAVVVCGIFFLDISIAMPTVAGAFVVLIAPLYAAGTIYSWIDDCLARRAQKKATSEIYRHLRYLDEKVHVIDAGHGVPEAVTHALTDMQRSCAHAHALCRDEHVTEHTRQQLLGMWTQYEELTSTLEAFSRTQNPDTRATDNTAIIAAAHVVTAYAESIRAHGVDDISRHEQSLAEIADIDSATARGHLIANFGLNEQAEDPL